MCAFAKSCPFPVVDGTEYCRVHEAVVTFAIEQRKSDEMRECDSLTPHERQRWRQLQRLARVKKRIEVEMGPHARCRE